MYNAFFGFDADPFRVNPDPRFLFMSESHAEALATLIYAVQERKGFITLTGEVGTGKTTILNALLKKLGPAVQTAYIFNTSLGVEDLFAALFEELELDWVEPFRKIAALSRLNHHLIRRLTDGQQTLLVIDEAQNLSDAMLEEVRMLSNLETPQSKLLQIMLVGQPELADKLSRPALRQLRQRVELRHDIRPLRADETASYIRERLLVAGHPRGEVFTPSAERAVYRFARGIPRVINVLCDNALIAAFARESQRVSAQMVELAASDLGLSASPGDPHFVRERSEPERRARAGWLRRLWRRGDAGPQPEL
ncbi:MAG: ExeA family protein [Myxococcota bacterium]